MKVSFFSYLDSLRHKSVEERRKVTFAITLITVVLVLILALVVGFIRSAFVENLLDGTQKPPRVINGIEAPY